MVRLRNALMIVALAAGAFGCAHFGGHTYEHWSPWHCSECDDFPMPAYGPNGSMMPGSYSGPPPEGEASSPSRMGTPTSSNAPVTSGETAVPPPDERPTAPTTTPPDMGNTPTPPTPPAAGNP